MKEVSYGLSTDRPVCGYCDMFVHFTHVHSDSFSPSPTKKRKFSLDFLSQGDQALGNAELFILSASNSFFSVESHEQDVHLLQV